MTLINWKTLEKDGHPKQPAKFEQFSPPYICCLVFSCNPSAPQGGVIETCRWDLQKSQWFRGDVLRNWGLQEPYVITHYCDDMQNPVDMGLVEPKYK